MTTARPRRGRPPASEGDAADTRRRIVEAATDLFADKGFHGTGVAEIGARAGVARGALYYHINSKEELLWQILSTYITDLRDRALAIAAHGDEPRVTLENLLRDYIVQIIRYRRQVAIQVRDGGALTGANARALQDLRDEVQLCWQRVIDGGAAAGQLRSGDHVVTNGILGMANMASMWFRDTGPHDATRIADQLTDLIIHGMYTAR